jgi:hypothetical protein
MRGKKVASLKLATEFLSGWQLRVIFSRRAPSALTAAYPQIAAVPGGCRRRQSWAKTRHAKWLEAHGEKIRRERNFCPSYLQPGFRDTEGVVRTGSG